METTIPDLAKRIPTENAAYRLLERMRWHGTPVCPHCKASGGHYLVKAKRKTTTGKVSQRRTWKCRSCRRQFSVLVGTIFHGSHIPIRTWLFVLYEMCASKNGAAAREIKRKYGLTDRAAWHMIHRIREGMADRGLDMFVGTIVADETWIGGKSRVRIPYDLPKIAHHKFAIDHALDNKTAVLSILNRDTGEVRSRVIADVTGATLAAALRKQVNTFRSTLQTDERAGYKAVGREFQAHETVNHADDEYVRGDVTTNDVESFFSQLKRSIDGTHHAISREDIHRYLAEFDFRFSTCDLTDSQRLDLLLSQVQGRRLPYRTLTKAA
jgi:transposase-like protein